MQFLVSVIDDGQAAAAATTASATDAEAAAIDAFNDRLRAGGHWVFAAGVSDPDEAFVVDARGAAHGSAVTRTAGPFVRTPEHVAGFWILDAVDVDTVSALVEDASAACNRKLEVRSLL
ncbi:YciI family protein [Curtobacterium sp. Leaf261]|uniref:YciI family protein n=1 Tax=Curtobacterium sp. Leaf261 TaxID=1736311 RepID=UPI00070143F4|nr:YciI family protein [Curtobacterium sp. Leaf261]KQO61280.1 hypothetical protein ASF23_12365 [Curtobacterium sp. Leaf261]